VEFQRMNKTDAAETDRAAITKTTAELLVLNQF